MPNEADYNDDDGFNKSAFNISANVNVPRNTGATINRPLRHGERTMLLELIVNEDEFNMVASALEFRMRNGRPMRIRMADTDTEVTIRQISRR